MCGIFGIISNKNKDNSGRIFRTLCLLSESRGKEASGFAIRNQRDIKVFKAPSPASAMVRNKVFRDEILRTKTLNSGPYIIIGHSRLVTNGYEQFDVNNQPVVKNGFVVIHNGIIVNQARLWQKFGKYNKISELDSELIPTIITHYLNKGADLETALEKCFAEIFGMTNIALIYRENNNLFLATNNGSIYFINDLSNDFFVFASERYILEKLIFKHNLSHNVEDIEQLEPNNYLSINFNEFTSCISKIGELAINLEKCSSICEIFNLENENRLRTYINTSLEHSIEKVPKNYVDTFEERRLQINTLKRCKKCILPETFPYITFDDKGICNYCNNYQKHEIKGVERLIDDIRKQRRTDGRPECLVPFSGGRDSSFALHYVVEELGLKPIAFSYDWGMITDLARRNQSRMCGKLGVEHILVSADIRKKRRNIRKNVLAWLKKPSLGTVPLFMAGDKQYFYFANKLMKQNDLTLSILGENLLETTNFKSGFCGVKPNFGQEHTYSLSIKDRIKMAYYYGYQFIINPAYLNSSIFDTIDAFRSYYLIRHNNINIYDYIKWNENLIEGTLIDEYKWETDPGTNTTWRIGDGTAAFYNFIYFLLAGFTENDTFRSNQIREGQLNRDKALELSLKYNQPRWDSIQWYCKTIGIDFENTIKIIHNSPTLY